MNTSAEINSSHADQTHHADAHKSPERLEQEVNQTRARIEDRLVSLTHRLSPGELLDQALGMAREHGGEFGHNLGTQVKQNPVPLVLTGIGLAWLMMGPRSSPGDNRTRRQYARGSEYGDSSEYSTYAGNAEYAGEYPRDYQSPGSAESSERGIFDKAKEALGGISDKAHHLSERAHGTADQLGERMHGAAERVQGMKGSMESQVGRASTQLRQRSAHARERMHSSQQQLSDFFREQPILAGGLGVALGAALGALLPPTETEDRLMGRSSADALEKAKATASQKFSGARDKVRETAQTTVDTLKENLKDNLQELKSAAEQAGAANGSASPNAAAPENSAQNNPSVF